MEMIKLKTHVGHDGILKLELPVGVMNTDLEVVVVMQKPALAVEVEREEWLAFVERTAGSLVNDPIERPPQGEYETRDDVL